MSIGLTTLRGPPLHERRARLRKLVVLLRLPTRWVSENVRTSFFEMHLAVNESVVRGPLPEVRLIAGPTPVPYTARPCSLNPRLEIPDDIRDRDRWNHRGVRAEGDNGVHVVRHDDVRVEADTAIVVMDAAEGIENHATSRVEPDLASIDAAE